jgi:aspartate oxidase
MATSPQQPSNNLSKTQTVQLALTAAEGVGQVLLASTNPEIAVGATVGIAIAKAVSALLQAHVELVGEPLDLTKLHPIDRVE